MHTRRQQSQTDPEPNRQTTRSRSTTRSPPAAIARTPTDRAPQTFAGSTRRLQNLVDEFNAAFPGSRGDRTGQS
ncbi:hypothetical protein [Halosolutus halophilus]|uniref:hypothetical protein n=1 Tax=Halosolutus halophilus TaxID=1552990 RepID=UPI002235092F|nr:hypothetical protein [Halosolutus halophilus]